jgi:hypothetical protein
LAVREAGKQFVVVQKGGFRRVREVSVLAGEETLPAEFSTLPPKTDVASGDEVPRMTVVHGTYDDIAASLIKLGVYPSAITIEKEALTGAAAKKFLSDPAKVNGRHIIFLPCGDVTQPSPNVDLASDPVIQKNLVDFVSAGGRLYVTDWHYDFIARNFPAFIKFQGASTTACSGCGANPYDAQSSAADPGLGAWLSAQGLASFKLERNYTGIASVVAQPVTVDGVTKTITPRVWMNGSVNGGPAKPATVSFEHGCGKVMFSTYHTEPSALGLTPQEIALLGVLLEVNVCNASSTGVVR